MDHDLRHDPVIASLISIVFSQGERLTALSCRVEAIRQLADVSMNKVERRAESVRSRLDAVMAKQDPGEEGFRAWLERRGPPPLVVRA